MEKTSILIAQALVGVLLFKILLKSLKWGTRLALNTGAGLICLGLINTLPSVMVPVNAITVLTAGILGIPGIGLLMLLERYL